MEVEGKATVVQRYWQELQDKAGAWKVHRTRMPTTAARRRTTTSHTEVEDRSEEADDDEAQDEDADDDETQGKVEFHRRAR